MSETTGGLPPNLKSAFSQAREANGSPEPGLPPHLREALARAKGAVESGDQKKGIGSLITGENLNQAREFLWNGATDALSHTKVFGQNLGGFFGGAVLRPMWDHKTEIAAGMLASGVAKAAVRTALLSSGAGIATTVAVGAVGGAASGAIKEYIKQGKNVNFTEAGDKFLIDGLRNEFRRAKAIDRGQWGKIGISAAKGAAFGAAGAVAGAWLADNVDIIEKAAYAAGDWVKEQTENLSNGTETPTTTPTITATASPTVVSGGTGLSSPTPTATIAEASPSPTATETPQPPTSTPTTRPTFTPTATETQSPTATATARPTFTPTAEPTVEPTASPSPTPTAPAPTPSPSPSPSPSPEASPPPVEPKPPVALPPSGPETVSLPPGSYPNRAMYELLESKLGRPPVPTEVNDAVSRFMAENNLNDSHNVPADKPLGVHSVNEYIKGLTGGKVELPVEIQTLPNTVTIESGSYPLDTIRKVSAAAVGRSLTDQEYELLTKEFCKINGIGVSEWNIEAKLLNGVPLTDKNVPAGLSWNVGPLKQMWAQLKAAK